MIETGKSSQQLIQEANLMLVFRLIHKRGTISRADIKKITGLSATTVSALTEKLIEDGYIMECGIKDSGSCGRKAILLQVCTDKGCFVGVEIVNEKQIVTDVYNFDFSTVLHTSQPIVKGKSISENIIRTISNVSKGREVLGIAIGVPGVINPETNEIVSLSLIEPIGTDEILTDVKAEFPDAEVCVKNNSSLVAYAEKYFGEHTASSDLVAINIDEEIRTGIIVGGIICNGCGRAGEFGHISIDYNGEKCKCGNVGCLDTIVTIPAILKKTKINSVNELRRTMEAGNKEVLDKIDNIAKALAFGINNIVNLIDPEVIILEGTVKNLGEIFLEMLRKHYEEIALVKGKTIEFSKLKGSLVTLGAARYLFDEIFAI